MTQSIRHGTTHIKAFMTIDEIKCAINLKLNHGQQIECLPPHAAHTIFLTTSHFIENQLIEEHSIVIGRSVISELDAWQNAYEYFYKN